MAGSRNAAVVLTGMEVQQVYTDLPNGIRCMLLFDVCVIGVEQHADLRVIDLPTQSGRVRSGVQEVRLVSVQRLDRHGYIVLVEPGTEFPKTLDCAFPFVFRATPPGQEADRRIQGSGNQLRANFRARFDTCFQVVAGTLSDCGVLADYAQIVWYHRAESSLERAFE